MRCGATFRTTLTGAFVWRLSDGRAGEGRLSVLGVGLTALRLPASALTDLPAAGEIEMSWVGVPFVWRIPLSRLTAGLGRLEACLAAGRR